MFMYVQCEEKSVFLQNKEHKTRTTAVYCLMCTLLLWHFYIIYNSNNIMSIPTFIGYGTMHK